MLSVTRDTEAFCIPESFFGEQGYEKNKIKLLWETEKERQSTDSGIPPSGTEVLSRTPKKLALPTIRQAPKNYLSNKII